MNVLGIGTGLKLGHHDGSATLIMNNRLVAAAEEERFLRMKHARGELPLHAIEYCLKAGGITIHDVDVVASPLSSYDHYDKRLQDYFNFHFGHSPEIQLHDHHLCHVVSTYRVSGMRDAIILSFDFSGDSCSGLIAVGEGDRIRIAEKFERHNSLGVFYGMLTQFLGFQMTNDEFKVMGLASFGNPEYMKEFNRILELDDSGFRLNSRFDKRIVDSEIYTSDFVTRQEQIFSKEMVELLGKPRLRNEEITQRHMDIAASGQAQLEAACLNVLRKAKNYSDSRNLCLAGGITLNVKLNKVLYESGFVDKLFIQPAAGDAGQSLGAAIESAMQSGNRLEKMRHTYYGPEYSNEEIESVLKRLKLKYRYIDAIESFAAEEISKGKILGWFQGRMEYGPRALGNRSILGDPRDPHMTDTINKYVKFREDFRPFCPSILDERRDEFFENCCESPFMTMLFRVKENKKDIVPAVTHIDGTARIQIVEKDVNPRYWKLIKHFEEITEVPLVLNTSMNVKGEPIVENPEQAVRVFYGSGMDCLVLGNFYISK